jgi:hypothetical protein
MYCTYVCHLYVGTPIPVTLQLMIFIKAAIECEAQLQTVKKYAKIMPSLFDAKPGHPHHSGNPN